MFVSYSKLELGEKRSASSPDLEDVKNCITKGGIGIAGELSLIFFIFMASPKHIDSVIVGSKKLELFSKKKQMSPPLRNKKITKLHLVMLQGV